MSIRVKSFLRCVVVLLFVLVRVPAVPFHCRVEVGDADAKIGDVGPENLTWCADRVIQLFLPAFKPFFFNLIAQARRQMLLYIFLKADGCGQHIAVFGHVADSRALFVLHVGSTVAIGACQAARSVLRAVTAVATMIGRTMRRGKANRARAIGVVSLAW